MKVDLARLQEEIDGGWVNVHRHPSLPLSLAKYSKSAVYSSHWNDITTICRGLVYDDGGNIVVHCLNKFYNHTQAEALPVLERTNGLPYEVFDKKDGSLLQVAKWNDHLIITSSGSFSSPQVHKAAEMLLKKYRHYHFENGLTYIMEIVWPQNKIVLSYGDEESLTLLAVRNTETGTDMSYNEMLVKFRGWDIVEKFEKTIPEILADLSRPQFINREGFVVMWSNGDRVKLKYNEYVRLHKLISGVSEKWVWQCLLDGVNPFESLIDVPDELNDFVNSTIAKYRAIFDEKMLRAKQLYAEVLAVSNVRKEQAIYVLAKHKSHAKLIFGLLDGRDISKMIYDEIEPSGVQQMKWGAGASVDEE